MPIPCKGNPVIDTLIRATRYPQGQRKKIAFIGDAMLDAWVPGHLKTCQDGCPCFDEQIGISCPGGAANAARQLRHWNVEPFLISPLDKNENWLRILKGINYGFCFPAQQNPFKVRLTENGKIIFRSDYERPHYGMRPEELKRARRDVVQIVKESDFDAILLSDYDKGFLDQPTIAGIIEVCRQREIPIVADGKKEPGAYTGAILKINSAYAQHYGISLQDHIPAVIITHGHLTPVVFYEGGCHDSRANNTPVLCRNHVGAGDCFAAHLILALAHGFPLTVAVDVGHAAGRVFVQHLHERSPWPHEIRADFWPVHGKVLGSDDAKNLRASIGGRRLIFTNGVFRMPHAGHAWLMKWAKQQGDVLVLGINTDDSAQQIRPGQLVLPLVERLEMLAGLADVDWVIPFQDPEPIYVIAQLEPDALVKGNEYRGEKVPGCHLVKEVLFAPESPFPQHATDIINCLKGA